MLQSIKKACLADRWRVFAVLLFMIFQLFAVSRAQAQFVLPDSALMLGAGAIAVGGASLLDKSAQSYFSGKGRVGELNWVGNKVIGLGTPGLILGAGVWLGGYLFESGYEIHSGRAQVESLVVTGILVTLAKSLSNRRRPNGEDAYSFPSAHSAYAFTTASVLQEFYGWKFGVPAYLLAGLTAASRMQDNQHWLSDTVAGAAVGIIIGTGISRWHLRRLEEEQAEWVPQISPAIYPEHFGLSLNWEF